MENTRELKCVFESTMGSTVAWKQKQPKIICKQGPSKLQWNFKITSYQRLHIEYHCTY